MQGADKVNDEIEVGFDEGFEAKWIWAERIGRCLMGAVLVAALAGLLGRGPLSHHTDSSDESALAVDFEPIARAQTGTQVTIHMANPDQSPTLDLFISTNSVEPMGLQRVLPAPIESRAVDGGFVLTVAVPPGTKDAQLRLMLQPTAYGPHQLTARLGNRAPLRWTQFVVP